MTTASLTLLGSLVLMVVAVVGAWKALDSQTETHGVKRGLLILTVFGGGFLVLVTAIILTARGACYLLDCRGYVETQQAAKEAAAPADSPAAPPLR